MKKITLLGLLSIFSLISFGQDLFIGDASMLTVQSQASLYINGLVLEPDTNYTLDTNTNIQRIGVPAETGNTAINRQYNISPELINYSGTLIFYYEDTELNSAIESELQLLIYDNLNAIWSPYAAILDTTLNTLTYNFTAVTNFSGVTADDRGSLSVETPEIGVGISIYPNPTKDFIYINYAFPIKTTLYSTTGKILINGTSKTVNLTKYEGATYFLTIEDANNKMTKTFKLIKN